tara:strand:- start:694 stop:978 length:285 start_codon:yes stop_codon:yes gene_type:complete
MSIISFEKYKETGKIQYVEDVAEVDETSFAEEMDSLATVMEMSTDELLSELSLRVNDENGLRTVGTSHLVDEITQRLLAIEYVLFLTMAKNTKK